MMKTVKLYEYTHKFGEYPKVCVVADNRNDANGLLAIYCNEHFKNFDGRYCDFECFLTEIPFAEKEDNTEIFKKCEEIRNKGLTK